MTSTVELWGIQSPPSLGLEGQGAETLLPMKEGTRVSDRRGSMSSRARTETPGKALPIACLLKSVVLGVDNLFTEFVMFQEYGTDLSG